MSTVDAPDWRRLVSEAGAEPACIVDVDAGGRGCMLSAVSDGPRARVRLRHGRWTAFGAGSPLPSENTPAEVRAERATHFAAKGTRHVGARFESAGGWSDI